MLRNEERRGIDLNSAFLIGLVLAFYFSGFVVASSELMYTVSGGTSRYYYQGFPLPCFLNRHEEVQISAEHTLYINDKEFVTILFLADWFIWTAIILAADKLLGCIKNRLQKKANISE